ncbi:MAG: hypothetical protein ACR2OW_08685 [Methyloligellaceae bacterium]
MKKFVLTVIVCFFGILNPVASQQLDPDLKKAFSNASLELTECSAFFAIISESTISGQEANAEAIGLSQAYRNFSTKAGVYAIEWLKRTDPDWKQIYGRRIARAFSVMEKDNEADSLALFRKYADACQKAVSRPADRLKEWLRIEIEQTPE